LTADVADACAGSVDQTASVQRCGSNSSMRSGHARKDHADCDGPDADLGLAQAKRPVHYLYADEFQSFATQAAVDMISDFGSTASAWFSHTSIRTPR